MPTMAMRFRWRLPRHDGDGPIRFCLMWSGNHAVVSGPERVIMRDRLITVFGGSGFVGRHVVERLAAAGARIRVAVRHPNLALFLKPMGEVGQIQIVQANIRDDDSVGRAVADARAVINLVGILCQGGRQRFDTIHAEGAGRIAHAAAQAGVRTLVHVSAIGADTKSDSRYALTKARGEVAVREAFAGATILRPSVVFGPGDDFLNRFALLTRLSPVLPLIGGLPLLRPGGLTRFQPVYVGDVATAAVTALGDGALAGRTFELGGPKIYTLRELYEIVLAATGRRRILMPIPFAAAKVQGWFLERIFAMLSPDPPLTVDQVRLLSHDNVVAEGVATLADLGVTPTPLETIVPAYLWRHRRGGQFSGPLPG